ncbi:MAG TPA: OsmC family protein [Candidatus Limnocylindrales bacterium]|nr:OsmC family protein [Candidatus Limnocylindrales bacterium]
MSDAYRARTLTVDGGPTALGSAGQLTVVVDRPVAAGGRGLGFNGGQLLYLSIAACVSNDLYREAATMGITIRRVAVEVDGDFPGRGAASTPVDVVVEIDAEADDAAVDALLAEVDRVAEIPNSLRGTTPVSIRRA